MPCADTCTRLNLRAEDHRKWESMKSMAVVRKHIPFLTLDDGFVYAIGGQSSDTSNTDVVERYDVANDNWETLDPHPGGYLSGSCNVVDKIRREFWLIGGRRYVSVTFTIPKVPHGK